MPFLAVLFSDGEMPVNNAKQGKKGEIMTYIAVLYYPFPDEYKVLKGVCLKAGDDGYLIAIDSNQPEQEQIRILAHEKAHIYCGHLDSDLPEEECEKEADEIAKLMLS